MEKCGPKQLALRFSDEGNLYNLNAVAENFSWRLEKASDNAARVFRADLNETFKVKYGEETDFELVGGSITGRELELLDEVMASKRKKQGIEAENDPPTPQAVPEVPWLKIDNPKIANIMKISHQQAKALRLEEIKANQRIIEAHKARIQQSRENDMAS